MNGVLLNFWNVMLMFFMVAVSFFTAEMKLQSVFLLLNFFGSFPIVYDPNKKQFSTSKCGLLIAFIHVLFVGVKIYKNVVTIFFDRITTIMSAIVLSTNGFGLLFFLLRRIILIRDTIGCYNSLPEWSTNIPVRKSLILYASTVAVAIEIIGDNIQRRMNGKSFNLDELTTCASLGFELQLIHTFHMMGQLYSDLNEYVDTCLDDDLERIHQARKRNLELYAFCKKFNSHYNIDLIIHFSCYQLCLLFELFIFMKGLGTSMDNIFYSFTNFKTIIRLIRIVRLLVVFICLIESSSYLHHKSVYTFYYILRNRVNYLRHQTKEQVYLFLNELKVTEVIITANHCYDVNKKFMYSIFGSIVTFIVFVIPILYGQSSFNK